MIPYLALRYSFSSSSHHRQRAVRIALSVALSLAVLMVTVSVMDYLQSGRFDRIRSVRSFDITLDGEHTGEMRARYPGASVFAYGETEALLNGRAYTVRFIGSDYDGGMRVVSGSADGLIVPLSLYIMGDDSAALTMLIEGRNGRMLPAEISYSVSGAFSTELGSAADSSYLFLPYGMMPEGVPVHTAIKGVSSNEMEKLRGEGLSGESWKEKESGLYSALLAEKVLMHAVLSLLFVIILVSAASGVRFFFQSRAGEIAELMVLGLKRDAAVAAFTLSFLIVILLGVGAGLFLSLLFIPLGRGFIMRLTGEEAALALPLPTFIYFSLFLLAVTGFLAARSGWRIWHREAMEVLSGPSRA